MKAYHTTTVANAASIGANGFQDQTGSYLVPGGEFTGVWVSDQPLDEADFTGTDFGRSIGNAVCFEIEIDESLIKEYEWVQDGWAHREWLVPAQTLNAHSTRRELPAEKFGDLVARRFNLSSTLDDD